MKIYVVDGSLLGAARLMTLMEGISECDLVGCAQDALSALSQIVSLAPDIVILDIHVQGGSGLTLLRQIKHDSPGTFIIVLTNASNDQYKKKCLELGADHFFDKSSEFQRVPAAVRSHIRSAHTASHEQRSQV